MPIIGFYFIESHEIVTYVTINAKKGKIIVRSLHSFLCLESKIA